MGTNLSGFCAADAALCGQPSATAQAQSQAQSSSYAPQFAKVTEGVTSAITNIAAYVGRNYVCPALPGLGAALAVGIGGLLIPEEITVFGAGGVAIAIASEELLKSIGEGAGLEARKNLCGY